MLSLNIPPRTLFGWFRRPKLWATADWQLYHDKSPAQASCLMQTFLASNHPGVSALLQPRFGTLWLLGFPKIKITFEGEEISDHRWDSAKLNGATDGNWENCVRSQGAYSEGDWGVIVLCTMCWIPSGQTSYSGEMVIGGRHSLPLNLLSVVPLSAPY